MQRQVEHLQDQVAQQAILAATQDLARAMATGELSIATIGLGAAGKTSLINRLIGAPVGAVAAAMGTTQSNQSYEWHLPRSDRTIRLIDTPGLAEAGVAGTQREQLARTAATQANLLLFVIDDDIRQGEYRVLESLLAMGKRTIVVLNKADRYTAEDLQTLLAKLRSHLVPPLSADDILAVAADPKPVAQQGGGWLQMRPHIDPLLARLADLLRQEGDQLIADNILLQSQQLGEKARHLLDQQRQTEADQIIDRYQWLGAAAIAANPLPGLEFLATAAVNAQMVVDLSRVYGYNLNLEQGKALALSLAKTLTGLGLAKGALDLLALGLQMNPVTNLGTRVLKGATGAYLTRIAGKSFAEYFRHHQDWGDGGIAAVVSQQFQLNQREALIKAFVRTALVRLNGEESP
ncbi:MAG: GTP-binding protein [Cyanobacteria bacterium REEB459]|nr:GTP-binding protein [Cyanobacteria bacterium REEB459]